MDCAVERVIKAIRDKEKILIFGDYDVDGITSTAILVRFLKEAGAQVLYQIPDRFRDGYGLKHSVIDFCKDEKVNLLITVDCGITSVDEVAYAAGFGIDVIVTDHHECKKELPAAVAVLNPKQPDCEYPFKNLAGVGVAFKLLEALTQALKKDKNAFFDAYIDVVTVGTIADVMPLIGENRILVKNGIDRLMKTTNPGLKALMKQASVDMNHITANTIGFALAPRINAAGRMDDPKLGVELLLAETDEAAEEKAKQLDSINRERQAIEQETYEEALSMLKEKAEQFEKDSVLVLAKEGWHSGIIGIVASKITDKFNKPCILLSSDGAESKGSGRSIRGFNLFEALSACGHLLARFGGHELAAGLTLETEKIAVFRETINAYAVTCLSSEDFIPTLMVDTKLPMGYANLHTVDKLSVLEPFGMHNPNPVFFCTDLRVLGVHTMGDGKHLRLQLSDGQVQAQAVGFSMGSLAEKLTVNSSVDIVFNLEANIYRGERRVQILLKDLRLSS
ncbi:MAG: single-stranded-DNA-specific exonuclease RecJ [Clostridia bacterium]|nr:single-stranded-DNA-specific exonuclease RecJ [Clostridia bacterium]